MEILNSAFSDPNVVHFDLLNVPNCEKGVDQNALNAEKLVGPNIANAAMLKKLVRMLRMLKMHKTIRILRMLKIPRRTFIRMLRMLLMKIVQSR